jgi:carbon monoxide dehydrogenase subunit G
MWSIRILTGGRESARRLLPAIAVAAMSVAPAATVSTSESRPPDIRVNEEEGVYTVTARFCVPQASPTVLAVLTDYEQIPRFMPGVTTSVVRDRTPERVIVEQEAVSRMMMFSKRVHLLLEVTEDSNTLRFRDSGGRSFAVYEGAWTLSRMDEGTAITYELRAKPKFDVPEFLLKRLLTRDAKSMIARLRAEIAARPSASFGTS